MASHTFSPEAFPQSSLMTLAPEKEFIFTLKSLPVLWDKSNPNYKNKYKRIEALQQLLVIYKKIKPMASTETVRRKINTLRSNYRKEAFKLMRSATDGQPCFPKGWVYEHLHFLYNFDFAQNQTEFSDNGSESQDQQWEYEDASSQQHNHFESSASSVDLEKHEPTTEETVRRRMEQVDDGFIVKIEVEPEESFEQNHIPMKRRKQTESFVPNTADSTQTTVRSLASKQKSSPASDHHHHNCIAHDWEETLDRLEPTQKLFAKKAINDILFEAELGNLNRFSVKINET